MLPLLSFFETRRRKQVTTFRGPIEIGTTLKINSYAYVKVPSFLSLDNIKEIFYMAGKNVVELVFTTFTDLFFCLIPM